MFSYQTAVIVLLAIIAGQRILGAIEADRARRIRQQQWDQQQARDFERWLSS